MQRKMACVKTSLNRNIRKGEYDSTDVAENKIENPNVTNITADKAAETNNSKSFFFRKEINKNNMHANSDIEENAIYNIKIGPTRIIEKLAKA
jgi:hypothetical protein